MLCAAHCITGTIKAKNLQNGLGYVLLPDAVRAYSGPRPYSHFERSSDGKDVSYWAFPTDVKGYTKEFIQADIKEYAHLAEIKPCAIGEDTDINAFYARNKHLPETMFTGIEMHLKQDIVFDKFIRDEIDCSNKYSDVFFFTERKWMAKLLDLLSETLNSMAYMCLHIR